MIDKREITPELLVRITGILFTKIPFQEVLAGNLSFDGIPKAYIADLMMEDEFFRQAYSKLECESYAQSIIDYISQKTAWQTGRSSKQNRSLNVFDLLVQAIQDLLLVENGQIECSYEQIMFWRMLTRQIGEEFPVAARYASWDYVHKQNDRSDFAWPCVSPNNNKHLNLILHRGIAEHHCHLWGSTPYFHVSWINLMNQLTNSKYINNFQWVTPQTWMDKPYKLPLNEQRSKAIMQAQEEEPSVKYGVITQLRAAWIRLYLFERLTGRNSEALSCADVSDVQDQEKWVSFLLCRDKLQSVLDVYSQIPSEKIDYALNLLPANVKLNSHNYEILIGERWLCYSIFMDYCKPIRQRKLLPQDYNLFFAYILIRTNLRSQMVQNNDLIGFDNFQRIQRRKNLFAGDPTSDKYLVRLAVNEPLRKKYIKELEVRITPDVNQLKRLEQIVNDEDEDNLSLNDRLYYVFHFTKKEERTELDKERNNSQKRMFYRQEKLRKKLMKETRRIIDFRENEPQVAKRVRGIDAASQEIGCRPEVFATVYRRLEDHTVGYDGILGEYKMLPALGKTYHVGEDFLDIVDGLRAIDEVIHFLNFDCGDRLGHAIVLGIDVEDWYEKKHRVISISVQDYLDNLAWLYHALNHFVVPDVHALKERIVSDFEYWFRIVYRNHMRDEEISRIMACARKECYEKTNEDHGIYQKHTCHFDIRDYYRAWTLRGDDPSCYSAGYFRKPSPTEVLDPDNYCKVNQQFPAHYEDRYVAEYSLLNFYYQYDEEVRSKGERRIKVDISDEYVRAVKAIQIEMRYRIARRGISIETNPTSNVLISTFRKYEDHPLLAFYNRGLPVSEQEEAECAQLHVSINTDDSGVFYTDLETEYALIARYVEQIFGDNDRPRFKKADIYAWLNKIRIMGLEQSFRALEFDAIIDE